MNAAALRAEKIARSGEPPAGPFRLWPAWVPAWTAWLLAGGVLLAAAFSIGVPLLVPKVIFSRQQRLPENSIWLAVDALAERRLGEAPVLVDRALTLTIAKTYEGSAQPLLAPFYLRLAEELFAVGWKEDGRRAAYKALGHYHRVPRPLEYLEAWRLLAQSYLGEDPGRFMAVADALFSHSFGQAQELTQTLAADQPAAVTGLTPYAVARDHYMNGRPRDAVLYLAQREPSSPGSELALALDDVLIRALKSLGREAEARKLIGELKGRYPNRLEPWALEALVERDLDAAGFADELKRGSPWEVLSFGALRPARTEYAPAREPRRGADESATLAPGGAGEIFFELGGPVENLYLIAAGTDFLGIYPIVIARLDEAPDYPLYLDAPEPAVFPILQSLGPGRHRLGLEFLNDYGDKIQDQRYERSVRLIRLVYRRP